MEKEKLAEEQFMGLRTIWDLFVKWHIAFNTFNLVGLGFIHRVDNTTQRSWLGMVFLIQNLLGVVTAVLIGRYSNRVAGAMSAPVGSVPAEHFPRTVLIGVAAIMGVAYLLFGVAWISTAF